jgi:hydrogenase nickel incorporation protein HypB
MCAKCGCADETEVTLTNLQTGLHTHHDADGHEYFHEHPHVHEHGHSHVHEHRDENAKVVRLEHDLLSKNARLAEQNRGWMSCRGIRAFNLMSSPGAGKTTLLERTIRELGAKLGIHVIEGDQATLRDAERVRTAGSSVIQINTGAGCHLDAEMIGRALRQLDPPARSVVMIENVGNLVCPAMFDLGEEAKVVVASVTDGDDKPAKYPHMFRGADVIVLNKIDLLPYVAFQISAFEQSARELNPKAKIFQISATRGDGLSAWYEWLRAEAVKTIYDER